MVRKDISSEYQSREDWSATLKPHKVDFRRMVLWYGITDSMGMSLSNSGRHWRTEKPGRAACPWGGKELDMTEWLNEVIYIVVNQTIKLTQEDR